MAESNPARRGEHAARAPADRVGLGWRAELAGGIFAHLDRIELLELIADDHVHATREQLRALRLLASQRPLWLHGVGLGLAGGDAPDPGRLQAMARLLEATGAQAWSEHLAFVRAGGHEIGHLAAPPRSARSAERAAERVRQAARVVGSPPCLENIATLLAPPGSTLDEAAWTTALLDAADAPLLLDLHNLLANALNERRDPFELMRAMPLQRVQVVHLSGGLWVDEPILAPSTLPQAGVAGRRLLDDHLHDVPPTVFALLEALAAQVPQALDVIIERDGDYPAFASLLGQLDEARAALARGRATQTRPHSERMPLPVAA